MVIDDFTTGALSKVSLTAGEVRKHQTGSMIGGHRQLSFEVINDHKSAPAVPDQEGSLFIGNGRTLVSNDVFAKHRFVFAYGVTEASTPAPLHLNLSKASKFLMHFDVMDKGLNINVELFPKAGTVRVQKGRNVGPLTPGTVEFPLSQFEPLGHDMSDVGAITVVIQDGSQGGGTDYAIRAIEVV